MQVLLDPNSILTILGLVAGGLVVLALAWKLRLDSSFAVSLLAALLAVEALRPYPTTNLVVELGPWELYMAALGLAALLRLGAPRRAQKALLIVLGIALLAVARSLVTFGIGGTDLAFRAELFFIIPALYGSTIRRVDILHALDRVRLLGTYFALLAIGRWGLLAAGISGDASWARDDFGVARVLTATEALIVLFALVISANQWWSGGRQRIGISPLLMLLVILLAQHRSVWVTGSIALGLSFLLASERKDRRLLAAGTFISFIVLAIAFLPSVSEPLTDSLVAATSQTGTWEWRVDRWGQIWTEHLARGETAVVIGSEYGQPWMSVPAGEPPAVSPHNYYVQIAVRLGLTGAAVLFGLYLVQVRRLARTSSDPTARILGVLLVAQLVFFLPYSGSPIPGLVLGLALAWHANETLSSRGRSAFRTVRPGIPRRTAAAPQRAHVTANRRLPPPGHDQSGLRPGVRREH